METDVAAIRGYVEQIAYWAEVLAYAAACGLGLMLFRLTIIARDRFNKRILGILLSLAVGGATNADNCPEDLRGIPAAATSDNAQPMPAGNWQYTCQETSSKTMTGAAGDCQLFPGQPFRFIKVMLRAHNLNAPDTTTDRAVLYIVYVHQINNNDDAIVFSQDFSRKWGSNDPWVGTSGLPGPDDCQCNPGCSDHCIYAAVLDYYRGGTGIAWPPGVSIVEQYQEIGLQGCGPPPKDSDGDGIPDGQDTDDDNDGIPDNQDPDDDGDGIPDDLDPDQDSDGDGIPDPQDPDDDGDGVPDPIDGDEDDDGDGIPNPQDPDDDGDGIPDQQDPDQDNDGDGIPNPTDPDDDNDGTPDEQDPDHPDGPGGGGEDPDDPDEPGGERNCDHLNLALMARLIGGKVLGFDGAMLEDVVAGWEESAGDGLRIPYLEPSKWDDLMSTGWDTQYITISGDGVIDVPGGGGFTITHWDFIAEIVRTAFAAMLIIGYAQSFLDLVKGS